MWYIIWLILAASTVYISIRINMHLNAQLAQKP